ncbi:MAG: hypothetical protein UW07_C0048G0009 [Candidatus Nomurabacteria bacterium GW2011_GWF2_43_8]|uniref:Uncharacterized protein n=3 Tax=Candidatus Nomuraibacteriota TaxID=1752729 RepID=A0A0G1HQX6_9BACT|nr:MAG: hypothetical protein UV76_C0016G0010 [Candidatus Nomurabacteria bacterium GW2011_GWA2_43_15]KKT18964.1 MAG: hypothetical protein UW02_C0018G0008 [Candidatus Nomurabacteria bacterium GW2011_GWB1_43_7]KKT22007.1 MAG: hypothetical protein UW07_C0048G0009 [Candidatus Nomurabacteria bacterium GW2011_GWF2_43_8]
MDGEEDVLEEGGGEFKTDDEEGLDAPPEGIEDEFGLEDPDDRYH